MGRFFSTVSLIFVLLLAMGALTGELDSASNQRSDRFQFVWSGLKDNRERLHQGVFRAKGREVDDDPVWGRLDGEVSIFCTFDYDKDLFRFDRQEPVRMSSETIQFDRKGRNHLPKQNPKKKVNPKESWTLESTGDKWVKTASQCIAWTKMINAVGIYRPHEAPSHTLKPFDVRALGLLTWGNLVERNTSWKDTCENYSTIPSEIVEERKGLWVFRWIENNGFPLRTSVWVDESQGFSPIRLHWQHDLPGKKESQWSEPKIVCEMESMQVGNVWVPHSFRIEDRELAPRIMSYQLTFEWESVNEKVSESLFTVEGMDLPEGMMMIDHRLGKPIIIRKIGEEKRAPNQPSHGVLRRYFIWLSFICLVVVGCIALYRRWSSLRVHH